MRKLKIILAVLLFFSGFGFLVNLSFSMDDKSPVNKARDYMMYESDRDKSQIAGYFDYDYFMPGFTSGRWESYNDDEKKVLKDLFLERLPRYGNFEKWGFLKVDKGMNEAQVVATNHKNSDIKYTFYFHVVDSVNLIYEIIKSDSFSEVTLIEGSVKDSFLNDAVSVFSKMTPDGKPIIVTRPSDKEKDIYNAAVNSFAYDEGYNYIFFADLPLERQRTLVKELSERFEMSQNLIRAILTKTDYWYMSQNL